MNLLPLSFFFSAKDPDFKTTTVVIQETPRYLSHSFVETPIYDFNNKKIGYKVSDAYVQEVEPKKYIIRVNNTCYVDGKGSVNWLYVFESDKPEIYYPDNEQSASTIVSGTGDYFGQSGTVTLFGKPDGSRLVTFSFTP